MSKLRFLFLNQNTIDADLLVNELKKSGFVFDQLIVSREEEFIDSVNSFIPDIVYSGFKFDTNNILSNIPKIKNNHPGIPIIIVTNNIDEKTANECIDAGAHDCILTKIPYRLKSTTTSALELVRLKNDNSKLIDLLKINEDRFHNIINRSSNLFYIHDVNGNYTYISPQTRLFFDCEPEEILNRQLPVNTNNTINHIGKEITQKAINTGKIQPPYELELIGKKGRIIWVEVHESPIIVHGKVTGIAGALVNITEWKHTFNKLIESEKKFRKLFSEAPDGIALINETGIIIDCNQAYCDILECNTNQLINTHIIDSVIEEEKHQYSIKFPELKKIGKVEGEISLITKNNKIIYTRRSASAIYNESGEFTGAIVHTNDITDQKLALDDIKHREARLSAIFKAADNVSFILTSAEGIDSKIQEFSYGSETIFGYSRDEVIGKPVSILHTTDTLNHFSKYLNKMKKGVVGFKGRSKMIKKSGEIFTALHTAYPVFDNSGKLKNALGVTMDISNIIEIEDNLKKREEQLTVLINTSPDLICFKDEKGRWQLANNTFLKRLQLVNFDYIGKTDTELSSIAGFYKDVFLTFAEKDEIVWNKGNILIENENILNPDGTTSIFEVVLVPLFHSNGDRKAMVMIARDITAHKELEIQLRHSHKMEAIGLMAGGIAHNFNNILQAIIGYVEFAKEGLEKTEQRYKDIEQINEHVRKATKLTRDLLAVGKDQYMDKSNVNLNDIIQPIVDLTSRVSSNIRIQYNAQHDLPKIYADGNQIDQVIMNIIFNARDAMPDGGEISIIAKRITLDEDYCSKNAWAKTGDFVLISISDNGEGMDEDTKRRIFEPYFTTKSMGNGVGLGLSTSFGIISQHKGIINVISGKNTGTTFEIYLPVI